jgi:hypothetical protein
VIHGGKLCAIRCRLLHVLNLRWDRGYALLVQYR